jgi:septum formation protein
VVRSIDRTTAVNVSPATPPPLVLASASPRRRMLLETVGLKLHVAPVEVDESVLASEEAKAYVERVVDLKLHAALRGPLPREWSAVLVADTTVVLDGLVLGKPTSDDDAKSMISRLVGRTHTVATRYAIAVPGASSVPIVSRTVETQVTMRPSTAETIRRYVATGEGRDKAGAYALQGIGSFLVERLVGSHSNVIGLPVCEVIADLETLGVLGSFP